MPLAVPLIDVASNPQAVHAGLSGAAVTDAGGNSLVRMRFDRSIETFAVFDSRIVDAPPFVGLPGTRIPMESVPTGVVVRGGA